MEYFIGGGPLCHVSRIVEKLKQIRKGVLYPIDERRLQF
jgi:hypothetical protein